MAFQPHLHGIDILGHAQLPLHGSDVLITYSAGNDVAEVIQSGIDVECKTMHGHPSAGPYAQCTYLPCTAVIGIQPHPGVAGITACLDAVIGQRPDYGLFKRAEVKVYIGKKVVEIQYGVPDNLPRAVVRDVPPPRLIL